MKLHANFHKQILIYGCPGIFWKWKLWRACKIWIWTSKIIHDLWLVDLFWPIKKKFHTPHYCTANTLLLVGFKNRTTSFFFSLIFGFKNRTRNTLLMFYSASKIGHPNPFFFSFIFVLKNRTLYSLLLFYLAQKIL